MNTINKIKVLLFAFLIYFPLLPGSMDSGAMNLDLQQELLTLYKEDQSLREAFIEGDRDPEIGKKICKLDASHTVRLKEILNQVGWPGYQLVGENGSNAMWLLVQHTPDREFQKNALEHLQKAVDDGDASPLNLAYLMDRVLMYEGKKQIYGTQWDNITTKNVVLYPTEDFQTINERRLSVGLNTIEESRQVLIHIYKLFEEDVSFGTQ